MRLRLGSFIVGLGGVCVALGLWIMGNSAAEIAALYTRAHQPVEPAPTATQDAINELMQAHRLASQRPMVH